MASRIAPVNTLSANAQLQNIVDLCGVIIEGPSHAKHQWIQYLATELKSKIFTPASLTFSYDETNQGFKSAYYNSLRQIFILLRDSMINQRYHEATILLKTLLSHPPVHMSVSMEMAIYRAGMEILYNTPSTEHSVIAAYVNQLRHLSSDINPKSLLVEHTTFLLVNGKLQEAKECVQQIPRVARGLSKSVSTQYSALLRKLLAGYIWYREWLESMNSSMDTDDSSSLFNQIPNKDISQAYTSTFDQASQNQRTTEKLRADSLEEFSEIARSIGEWDSPLDMFISAYVHLLVSKGQVKEASDVLKQNVDGTKVQNPNSYKLYIEFHLVHRDMCTLSKLTAILKEYLEKWPSDINYAERYLQLLEEELAEQLSVLFHLLDYPINSDKVELWIQLERLIKENITDDKLKKLWTDRSSWWPQFHSNYHQSKDLQHHIRKVLDLLNAVT